MNQKVSGFFQALFQPPLQSVEAPNLPVSFRAMEVEPPATLFVLPF